MTPHSCIYSGHVYHHRYRPVEHRFRFPLFMLYVDLDELPQLFRRYWLWSAEHPNLAWFRRGDHVGDPERSLSETVRNIIATQTGTRPQGPIRLLTHFRYFGYVINPISLFYCFNEDQRLQFVVAEVTNTPWEQRHCYVLDVGDTPVRARKALHVSPFMGMSYEYEFDLAEPGEKAEVRIVSFQTPCDDGSPSDRHAVRRPSFDALLQLQRTPISSYNLAIRLLRYPAMTLQVVAAIYWQAFRLWLKGADFYKHPDKLKSGSTASPVASGPVPPDNSVPSVPDRTLSPPSSEDHISHPPHEEKCDLEKTNR